MPVPTQASSDLIEGWKALEESTDRFALAMAYYQGTVAERFANERIRTLVARAGSRYRFKLAAIPVKVMAKRCRIANVTGETDGVTARLEEIRRANDAVLQEPHIIRRGFIYGDAYALVWPVEAEEADVDQVDGAVAEVAPPEAMAQAGVEISYQSPLHCVVIYDSEDGRRPRFALRRWKVISPLGDGADLWRAEVLYHDRIERWTTKAGSSGGSAQDWMPYVGQDELGNELYAEDANWPEDHDWDELPIKHLRTSLPYGEPIHAAAFGPQDAITKAITTQLEAGVEGWGWPERYRILDDQRALEVGREPVNWGDSADAPAAGTATNPEVTGRTRGPGTETAYPGTKSVGEWTRPDPGVLINPIDQWLRMMSVVTETPLDELDPTVQLSGVSREKADAPMKAKERDLKLYLDSFWVQVYTLAVRMTGMDPGAISIHWAPPDVTMDSDFWVTAKERVQLGVPVRQILTEANYTPENVDAWLDSQGEELALVQRIGILKSLGEAIQTLGVGIQLGVLDQATAGRLVERITGEVESTPEPGQ